MHLINLVKTLFSSFLDKPNQETTPSNNGNKSLDLSFVYIEKPAYENTNVLAGCKKCNLWGNGKVCSCNLTLEVYYSK
jgi:hypothetical protein